MKHLHLNNDSECPSSGKTAETTPKYERHSGDDPAESIYSHYQIKSFACASAGSDDENDISQEASAIRSGGSSETSVQSGKRQIYRTKHELRSYVRDNHSDFIPLIEKIEQQIEVLNAVISLKNMELANAPVGTLVIRHNGPAVQYMHRLKPDDRKGKYIKNDNIEVAYGLAQKSHDIKILKMAEEQKDNLMRMEKYLLESGDLMHRERSVYEQYSYDRKLLVSPIWDDDDRFAGEWQKQMFKSKSGRSEAAVFETERGEMVRSKSEKIIADTLYYCKVPYRYEQGIKLKNGWLVYPDFTVLNVGRRKEYIWEHLGMTGNEEYMKAALDKFKNYIMSGYFPGENMLITAESSEHPLDTVVVKAMIERYLL